MCFLIPFIGVNQIDGQEVWTPYGNARITKIGVVLDTENGQRYLTFNENEVDLAFMCGFDDWLFVLRTSGYRVGEWEYPIEISEILKVNLVSGIEEKLTFKSTVDLTEEENWRNLNPPLTLTAEYFFDGRGEGAVWDGFGAVSECYSCAKIVGLPATRIDAGCSYPYLYFTIPSFGIATYLHRYDVIRDEDKIISSKLGPRLIHNGPLRGNLVAESTFHNENGRVFKDVVIDSEGEELKEIGGVNQGYSDFDEVIERWTKKSTSTCNDCATGQTGHFEEQYVRNPVKRVDFNGNYGADIVGKIAVIPKLGIDCKGRENNGKGIAHNVEGVLLDRYEIVERSDIEVLLEEQRLSLAGLIDEQTTVEAGKNIGAQGVVIVQAGCIHEMETIYVKLINSESSEIYWSCTGYEVDVIDLVDELSVKLSEAND